MQKPSENTVKNFESKTSAEILNAIRNDAMTTSAYKSAVPLADEKDISTLHAIGNVLNSYPELQNEFANALIGRIALTLIKGKSFMNPYRMFKRGLLEQGEIVQDIYIDLISPHKYDPADAESTWMRRELPTILAQYYRINSKTFYKVTISTADLNRAFINWNGVTDLVARIVGRLLDSMQYDEFMATKYMISRYILDGRFNVIPVTGLPDKDIATIKGISNSLIFPSVLYNPAGVMTNTERDEQYLFIGADMSAQYDVEVLAKAFNMERVEFLGHQVMFDNLSKYDYNRMKEIFPGIVEFTEEEENLLDSIVGVLVDIDAFMIFDDLMESRQQENGQGLYWQHWLHSWKTFAMSPFANQIAFVKEVGTVTELEITPDTITGVRGKSVFFTANATISGIASGAVEWSVDSQLSHIGSDGQLNIAPNEPKTTLIVTATSRTNSTVTATATVTLPAL